jgi:hypothetical protein
MEFKLKDGPNVSQLIEERLDPDSVEFGQPDFGFDSTVNFEWNNEESADKGWRRFMDCVSLFPKHERVKNYIEFVN